MNEYFSGILPFKENPWSPAVTLFLEAIALKDNKIEMMKGRKGKNEEHNIHHDARQKKQIR